MVDVLDILLNIIGTVFNFIIGTSKQMTLANIGGYNITFWTLVNSGAYMSILMLFTKDLASAIRKANGTEGDKKSRGKNAEVKGE